MAEVERIDTITLSKCGVDSSIVLGYDLGVRVPLLRITGIANGIKARKNNTTGELMEALKGDFHAINLQTGKEYKSALAYLLQGGSQDVVQGPIEAAEAKGRSAEVPFAVDIYGVSANKVRDGKTKKVYEFVCSFLNEPQQADPLAELKASLPPLPSNPPKPATEADAKAPKEKAPA